jgi:hypothetical protein
MFDQVRVVERVGGDFADDGCAVLQTRGTLLDDVEMISIR